MATRTTHRSTAGKKLYAVRDASGRFKDIQTYERAHRQDLKSKSGAALDYMLPELEAEPLQTFWYYQARLKSNFKLIHDTNSEFYHDYLHVYNRITGMLKPDSGYFQRK